MVNFGLRSIGLRRRSISRGYPTVPCFAILARACTSDNSSAGHRDLITPRQLNVDHVFQELKRVDQLTRLAEPRWKLAKCCFPRWRLEASFGAAPQR
jgi:hypothetical protein